MRVVGRERPLPFAPIGSERYGGKCIFAVIEFAKPGLPEFNQQLK